MKTSKGAAKEPRAARTKKEAAPDGKQARAWLGVMARTAEVRPAKSWWCAAKDASPGDALVMYQAGIGIIRIERIESVPTHRETRCSQVNLMTVDTRLVSTLKQPITAKELRSDPALRSLSAVRRSFQGTCFRVPAEQWPRLKGIIDRRL
jgi:hypothetical protein